VFCLALSLQSCISLLSFSCFLNFVLGIRLFAKQQEIFRVAVRRTRVVLSSSCPTGGVGLPGPPAGGMGTHSHRDTGLPNSGEAY
jgi:hypothetical protein